MPIQARSLAELTQSAIHLLAREMGVANTMRFLHQFGLGSGDYTRERRELFDDLSLEEILAEIEAAKQRRA
jgi:hypothetical protein